MSGNLAAIIGGAAGAVALVGIVIFFIWFCLSHKTSVSRTSETGSSDPSIQGNFYSIYIYFFKGFKRDKLNIKSNQFIVFLNNLQWEDMLGLSCHYEKQGVLRWKNCCNNKFQ